MKTKNIFYLILITITFSNCGAAPEEKAQDVLQGFLDGVKAGDYSVYTTHCSGEMREMHETLQSLVVITGHSQADMDELIVAREVEIVTCEALDGFYDIVLATTQNAEKSFVLSYLLQQKNNGEWKIMAEVPMDLRAIKSIITSDYLEEMGIYTVSDKDLRDVKELFGLD